MIDALIYIGIGYSVIAVCIFLFMFLFFGNGGAPVLDRFGGGLVVGLLFPWFAWIWYSEREQRQAQRDFLATWNGEFDAEGENNEKDI